MSWGFSSYGETGELTATTGQARFGVYGIFKIPAGYYSADYSNNSAWPVLNFDNYSEFADDVISIPSVAQTVTPLAGFTARAGTGPWQFYVASDPAVRTVRFQPLYTGTYTADYYFMVIGRGDW